MATRNVKKNWLKITIGLEAAFIIIVLLLFYFGYIQFEQIHSDYNGDYSILTIKNNNVKPYHAVECQSSSKYFLIRCNFVEVLENSTDLRGPND